MLLGLGFASMSAATLADQRRQLAVHIDVLDPGAVAAGAAARRRRLRSERRSRAGAPVGPLDVFQSAQVLIGV